MRRPPTAPPSGAYGGPDEQPSPTAGPLDRYDRKAQAILDDATAYVRNAHRKVERLVEQRARAEARVARRVPPWPTTRGAEGRLEPILGGKDAAREAVAVVEESIVVAQRYLDSRTEEERKHRYWARQEAFADEQMKDALSLTVAPRDGEDEDAYDARLTAIYENLRLRLDVTEPVIALPTNVDARPPPRVQADLPKDRRLAMRRAIKPTRREMKRVRKALFAEGIRKPTLPQILERLRGEYAAR